MSSTLPGGEPVDTITTGERLFARLCLVAAAVLWSASSLFVRILHDPTPLHLEVPYLTPLQLAFFRAFFAGLVLLPIVPWKSVRFRPAMFMMVACFATMSGLYLTALGSGLAANAILLQNTAPVWVYLVGVYLLGETAVRRDRQAIFVGLLGAIVLVLGNSLQESAGIAGEWQVLGLGLASGMMYAAVILFLRQLRKESPALLTVLNMMGSAVCLGIVVGGGLLLSIGSTAAIEWFTAPTSAQLAVLFVFGALQMALPYWLFARGLRSVSPQEAGIITLLEPILNPIWAYLIAPDREVPTLWTYAGGSLLLAALAWRYLPTRRRKTV